MNLKLKHFKTFLPLLYISLTIKPSHELILCIFSSQDFYLKVTFTSFIDNQFLPKITISTIFMFF